MEPKRIPYWEFHYRKNPGDKGNLYVVFDKAGIPEIARPAATKRWLVVPFEIWARRDFDPLSYLNMTQK